VEAFVRGFSRETGKRVRGITVRALRALREYDWPGNVRELERMMESAVVLARGHQVELQDLPREVRADFVDVLDPSLREGETLREWSTRYVKLVLHRCGNNKRAACRALDISYHTLQTHLRAISHPTSGERKTPLAPAWPQQPLEALVHERAPEDSEPSMPSGP
jgi:transcriptional regulator with PAS, ATPase and Fis domain